MAELVVTNLTETETETARRRFTGAGDSSEVGFFMTNPYIAGRCGTAALKRFFWCLVRKMLIFVVWEGGSGCNLD